MRDLTTSLSEYVLHKYLQPNKVETITMNNFFKSIAQAFKLLSENTLLVGAIRETR